MIEPRTNRIIEPKPSGQIFGMYRFFHILAEGAMGMVLEAEHIIVGRRVALKVVNPKYAAKNGFSPQLIDSFLREARILAACEHANVLPLYDAGVVGQCPYLAVRLMPAGDLESRILRGGTIDDHQALELLDGCARGIGAMHAAGWLNRDMKPANILLEADGTPRVSDFGIAIERTKVRADGTVAGTPNYLPPEVISGEPPDERSDLYSLGATIHFALAGKPPVEGGSMEEIARTVMAGVPIVTPTKDTPEGRSLRAILTRLMSPEPTTRYASAAQVVDDVQAVLHGRVPPHAGDTSGKRKSLFGFLKRE
jgi:serine/threonine protein kinase